MNNPIGDVDYCVTRTNTVNYNGIRGNSRTLVDGHRFEYPRICVDYNVAPDRGTFPVYTSVCVVESHISTNYNTTVDPGGPVDNDLAIATHVNFLVHPRGGANPHLGPTSVLPIHTLRDKWYTAFAKLTGLSAVP